MKLSLVVMTSGNTAGKTIAIPVSKFLIGREPGCQLRPASSLVSKRHCAIHTRDDKVFIQDFNSTNGTLVNNVPVKGEIEIYDKDRLKIGPLLFEIRIETSTPVSKPTPLPASRKAGKAKGKSAADEEAAALLLSGEEGGFEPSTGSVDQQGIPTGSTVFETGALSTTITPEGPPAESTEVDLKEGDSKEGKKDGEKKADEKKEEAKKLGDTSVAAQAILDKYLRRPRS
jgi:pSer/pThr/pTyr-binding forkhead associated (FHA) protein